MITIIIHIIKHQLVKIRLTKMKNMLIKENLIIILGKINRL